MRYQKRIEKVLEYAPVLNLSEQSKYILFSDIHRGTGDLGDSLTVNQQVYFASLQYYLKEGFTYIELGDGDELWENRRMRDIQDAHSDIFWLLSEMYKKKQFHMIYGNHDKIKKYRKFRPACESYYCEVDRCRKRLFPNMVIPEGIVLQDDESGYNILLIHGNQGDPINDRFWKLGRFLVRYLWSPLNAVGLIEPTSAAKNHTKKNRLEKKMIQWSSENEMILISGHTHHATYPKPGEKMSQYQNLYFNTGSCIQPRCITGIEIQNGEIALIKWSVVITEEQYLKVERDILEGPYQIAEYYK